MTTQVKISDLIKGLSETVSKEAGRTITFEREGTGEVYHLLYRARNDAKIEVEATATMLIEQLLQYPGMVQEMIFQGIIAHYLNEPGDSIEVIDDKDKKQRTARFSRVKSNEESVIMILVTR